MADPTDPTNPTQDPAQLSQAYSALQAQTDSLSSSQSNLDKIFTTVGGTLNDITNVLTRVGTSFNNLSALNDQQLKQFTALSAAFIQAREAFTGFSNVDTGQLSTLRDTIKDLKDAIGGSAFGTATKEMGALVTALQRGGVSQDALSKAQSVGKNAVLALAESFSIHIDNLNRLQNAYIQTTAATGDLSDVWNTAGNNLENMNDLLAKQTEMMADTIGATGLSAKQVEEYYAQLGQIPGALNATVVASEKGGDQTSMLTAAIEVATGTGRKYADVMTDLKTAFQAYGLVGENALRFSTRMSDVSSRLKAPIDDVTKSLRNSASAFQMFATGQENAASSAESLAKTLNTYGKALESTGLSATAAVEVAGNLSNQVAKLSVGQLAFISQQTGGAGGLQGAAQETLKLQTDPGAVVKDAMNTLKQQFGRIVTVQEAATSQAAAAQNIKQTALLQQLLGPLAKDQATANRLLEAMKNQDAGQPDAIAEELKPTGVQDAAAKGIKLQEGSYSELTKIRTQLERMRYLADQGAGRTFQTALTARGGVGAGLAQGEMSTNLRQAMHENMSRGGTQVNATAEGMTKGKVSNTSGKEAATAIHTALGSLKDIPLSLRAIGESLQSAFNSGDQDAIQAQTTELQQQKASMEAQAKMLQGNPDAQARAAAEANTVSRLLNATTSSVSRAGIQGTPGAGATPAFVPGNGGTNTLNIVGKISIDCPHCGKPHDASNQFKIYSGPSGQTGQ